MKVLGVISDYLFRAELDLNLDHCDNCGAELVAADYLKGGSCRSCRGADTRARKAEARTEAARPCREYDDVPLGAR